MIKLFIDSGCDFSDFEKQKYNIDVIPIYVLFNDKEVLDFGWSAVPQEEYYDCIRNKNSLVKTAQPSFRSDYNILVPYLEQGYDILYISISKEYSGGYKEFCIAKSLLASKYPNSRIEVFDSKGASIMTRALVLELCNAKAEDWTMDQCLEFLIQTVRHELAFSILGNLKSILMSKRTDASVDYDLNKAGILHFNFRDTGKMHCEEFTSQDQCWLYIDNIIKEYNLTPTKLYLGQSFDYSGPKLKLDYPFKEIEDSGIISPTCLHVIGNNALCVAVI